MTPQQLEVLTILQEECAEVIVEVSKIKRFGIEQNDKRLAKELADLQVMMDLVFEKGVLELKDNEFTDNMKFKRAKLKVFSGIFAEPSPEPEYSEHQLNSIKWFGSPNGA